MKKSFTLSAGAMALLGAFTYMSVQAQQPGQQVKTATADDDVVVKGAVDHYDGQDHARKPETPAQVEVKKKYSPYAGRKFPTRVFFGDTHNHTANSGDAFMAGNRLTPEQAYRFARGEEVISSTGVPAKLSRPLDFLVVSDHAEGLGVMFQLYEGNPAFMADPTLARWSKAMRDGGKRCRRGRSEKSPPPRRRARCRHRSRTRRSSARS